MQKKVEQKHEDKLVKAAYNTTSEAAMLEISRILESCSELSVLNIGCGGTPIKGAINLDRVRLKGVDIMADIRNGLPFSDNSFDLIIAFNILEHLTVEEFEYTLREMRRVCKQKALIKIGVPFFSSEAAFSTIDHKIFFAYNTFWRYREGDWDPTTEKLFKEVKVRLVWHTHKYLRPLNFLISKLINCHYLIAMFYQNFFCFLLPMKMLDIVARVEKE